MRFRSRLVLASSVVTFVTLGGAFTAVAFVVGRSQARELDEALKAESKEEAAEAAVLGGRELAIIDGPGPYANDVGPLNRYAAIYDASGALHDATSRFRCVPSFDKLHAPVGVPFDLPCGRDTLRGVLANIPHSSSVLLLASSRAELQHDAALLERAMLGALCLAAVCSILVTAWVVRILTREHQAIADVSRRVAAGDLSARVDVHTNDADVAQLGGDINEMIHRLSTLVQMQQRFIANAAHELRSPLTTLYGELSLAVRRQRSTDEYRRAIDEALESTKRLRKLADELLVLARVGGEAEVSPSLVSVSDIVQAGVRDARAIADEKRISLVTQCEGEAFVRGSRTDLARVVRNLVDNAVRHAPVEGSVSVSAKRAGDAIEIEVHDDGPGIPADDQRRIFEPFFRGATERADAPTGAGLGLAISREIARAHDGDIELAPTSRGARFVVTLPGPPP